MGAGYHDIMIQQWQRHNKGDAGWLMQGRKGTYNYSKFWSTGYCSRQSRSSECSRLDFSVGATGPRRKVATKKVYQRNVISIRMIDFLSVFNALEYKFSCITHGELSNVELYKKKKNVWLRRAHCIK